MGFDYLLARPPWWLVGLLAIVAIFSAVRWDRMLHSVCRKRFASGNEPILSFFDIQEASLNLKSKRLDSQSEPFQKIANWMVGVGLVSLVSVVVLRYAPDYWFTSMIDRFLTTYLPIFAIWSVMLVQIKWWGRIPFLATMITRPPNRESQIKQIFLGVAADFARVGPLLFGAAICLVMRSSVADELGGVAEAGLTTVLFTAGVVAVSYALTLAVITVRSTRWVIASCFLAVIIWGLFSGMAVYFGHANESLILDADPLIACSTLSLVLMAVAVGVTILMWRRYNKIEWGSFLS